MDKQETEPIIDKPRCKFCGHLLSCHFERARGRKTSDGYCNMYCCVCPYDKQQLVVSGAIK